MASGTLGRECQNGTERCQSQQKGPAETPPLRGEAGGTPRHWALARGAGTLPTGSVAAPWALLEPARSTQLCPGWGVF